MILIIGGAGQGKLDYALAKTGLTPEQAAYDPEGARDKRIFAHLERWAREAEDVEGPMEELLAANPEVIILCDEVGCGVVPVAPDERAWRERVGRLCCALARRADRVERIFCGLSMVLKGDSQAWN